MPFGVRCFEAGTYMWAALLCVRAFSFLAPVGAFGPLLVDCIGIFFVTRVLVELAHVLLHEAFALNNEARPVDQKAQTLVPLLCSLSQYALYFGAGLVMLNILSLRDYGMPIMTG